MLVSDRGISQSKCDGCRTVTDYKYNGWECSQGPECLYTLCDVCMEASVPSGPGAGKPKLLIAGPFFFSCSGRALSFIVLLLVGVVAHAGVGFPSMDLLSKSDPFVKIDVISQAGTRLSTDSTEWKSKTVQNDNSPYWNYKLDLAPHIVINKDGSVYPPGIPARIDFHVFDEDPIGADKM